MVMSTRVCVSFEDWRAMWALLGRAANGDPDTDWFLIEKLRVWMDGHVGGQLTETAKETV